MLTTLQNFSIYFWPTLHNTSYIFYTYHLYPRPTALSLSHKTRCLSQFPYTLPFSPLLYRLAAKEIKSPAECYHVVSYPRTNDLSTKCYKCIYRQPLHGGRNVKLRYFAFGAVSIEMIDQNDYFYTQVIKKGPYRLFLFPIWKTITQVHLLPFVQKDIYDVLKCLNEILREAKTKMNAALLSTFIEA